jgi:very-short-patch-repair endonuclease
VIADVRDRSDNREPPVSNSQQPLRQLVDEKDMRRRAWTMDAWRGAQPDKLSRAREMRRTPTQAEAALWRVLRHRGLQGWRFRRQHVVAGYIVDFYCFELGLAIEVDGGVHDERRSDDERRDVDLAALGLHVIRIPNADVLGSLDGVIQRLAAYCESLVARLPPPRRATDVPGHAAPEVRARNRRAPST